MSERCEVTRVGRYTVGADRLWALVSDFGGIADILDGVASCSLDGEGVGAIRSIPAGGGTVRERLDELDPDAHRLTYSIVDGPMPFVDYSATMAITEDGKDACTLTWTGSFQPDGIPADKAERLAGGIYEGGIAGFRAALDGRSGDGGS
ncbi:MAG: SRPBCC family protein [Acidimicrobiales bacterium]